MSFPPFHRQGPPARPAATADYIYDLTPDKLLIIIDELSEVSVTNDIRNVLAEITKREGLASLARYRVTYRDSDKIWFRVRLSAQGEYERITGFGVLVTEEAEAIRLLREVRA